MVVGSLDEYGGLKWTTRGLLYVYMNLGNNILLGMPALLGAVFFMTILFIYLAVPGLSYGMWDLQAWLRHTGSFSCSMWTLVP